MFRIQAALRNLLDEACGAETEVSLVIGSLWESRVNQPELDAVKRPHKEIQERQSTQNTENGSAHRNPNQPP